MGSNQRIWYFCAAVDVGSDTPNPLPMVWSILNSRPSKSVAVTWEDWLGGRKVNLEETDLLLVRGSSHFRQILQTKDSFRLCHPYK